MQHFLKGSVTCCLNFPTCVAHAFHLQQYTADEEMMTCYSNCLTVIWLVLVRAIMQVDDDDQRDAGSD